MIPLILLLDNERMLNLLVNRNVETEFRKTIGEARGIYRGNLRNAIEEALFLWIQTYKKGYGLGYTDAMRDELDKLRTQESK